jgi:hypothetical protein
MRVAPRHALQIATGFPVCLMLRRDGRSLSDFAIPPFSKRRVTPAKAGVHGHLLDSLACRTAHGSRLSPG